jgi:CelD/BcsL family acetyltransferase involved in cellulose biosynthesis
MNIELIKDQEAFLGLRDEWNSLLKSSASNAVFLTHQWLSAWWRHLSEGRELSILLARENGNVIGILPIARRQPQYARMMPTLLEFLGSGLIGSDYLDLIAKPGREADVSSAFAAHLHTRGIMLQLSQLRSGNCVVSHLVKGLQQHQWTAAQTKLNVCPYIDLAGLTWERYLANLGPSVRKNINRYLRILPTHFEMRVSCAKAVSEVDDSLDILIDLHRKRWGATGLSEAFQTSEIIAFHREFARLAAAEGWLRILVLWLNGQPAASLYGLRYGPTFYFYQSGFDPAFNKHSVGVATMGLAIKSAIEEGALEYDFLHGDEEYKFHWASANRDLGRTEVFPPHARARLFRHAIHWNRAARKMARRVLRKA